MTPYEKAAEIVAAWDERTLRNTVIIINHSDWEPHQIINDVTAEEWIEIVLDEAQRRDCLLWK